MASSSAKLPKINNFELLKVLGVGAFGCTYLSRDTQTNTICAVKTILKDDMERKNNFFEVLIENRVLKELNHPFVVKAKSSFQTKHMFCFVTEYLSGGELFYHIDKKHFHRERHVAFYSAEILLALNYLHSINIVYRDLKLENIMLDGDGHIRLIDFGLCKDQFDPEFQLYETAGTPSFHAPEVITKEGYGYAVDWWSLGIVTYELIFGIPPFAVDVESVVHKNILNNKIVFPRNLSPVGKSLLKGLLTKNQNDRLGSGVNGVSEIMEHPFYKRFNWKDLEQKKYKPPFRPQLEGPTDTRYFEDEFTSKKVKLPKKNKVHHHYTEFEEWRNDGK